MKNLTWIEILLLYFILLSQDLKLCIDLIEATGIKATEFKSH